MSAATAVRWLLANAAAVTAIVPATRIQTGDLPLGILLPAIGVKSIGAGNVWRPVRVGTIRVWEERVQVTAMADNTSVASGYTIAKSLIPLIVAACPSQRATINGVAVESIIPESIGPDLETADLEIATSSVDLIVRWSA